MFVIRTKCYFPPFCISQETFPRVPRGLVITTTKNCGTLSASKGHLRAPYMNCMDVFVNFGQIDHYLGILQCCLPDVWLGF